MFFPTKGGFLWTNSYSKTPKHQMSTLLLCSCLIITSGARYSWVPQRVFLGLKKPKGAQNPKSQSFHSPVFESKIFSGLMSLCTRPWLCKYATADTIWLKMQITSLSERSRAFIQLKRFPCSKNSRTKYRLLFRSNDPNNLTIFGCWSRWWIWISLWSVLSSSVFNPALDI